MVETQVQLEDWQYAAARRRATQLSRSMSDLVREGLTLVLRRLEKAPAGDLESIAGKYEPRDTSDLKDHDRWFVESDPMTTVFVDTSGFYAFLDKTDPFHREAKELFLPGREENWGLLTSSLVVQETWALIQARLGWDALEDWLCSLLPLCQMVWIDERLYELGAARARAKRGNAD